MIPTGKYSRLIYEKEKQKEQIIKDFFNSLVPKSEQDKKDIEQFKDTILYLCEKHINKKNYGYCEASPSYDFSYIYGLKHDDKFLRDCKMKFRQLDKEIAELDKKRSEYNEQMEKEFLRDMAEQGIKIRC